MPEIMLGGPDPFPSETVNDCPEAHGTFGCTRDAGHDLPHVAVASLAGNEFVAAVWPPYQEATPEQVRGYALKTAATLADQLHPHRSITQIADDMSQAVRLSQLHKADELAELMAPYFDRGDWCCLFAFVGGLLERVFVHIPPLVPGHRYAVGVAPGASPGERVWADIIAARVEAGPRQCMPKVMVLFRRAVQEGTVGAVVAAAVKSAADVDRRAKASQN